MVMLYGIRNGKADELRKTMVESFFETQGMMSSLSGWLNGAFAASRFHS
jgi:hypothetical protein